ncbi:MAG: hypothetical protein HUJ68_07665, partial [Clostridia bacterium]|nr:hypothetical protein [Clostridia bacterium]
MTEELKEYYKSNRTITEGTYKKYQGMYLGVQNNPSIKENRNILVTYFPSNNVDDCDYITYPKKYKRDTKIKSTGEIRKAGQTYPTTKRIVRKHKSDMYPNLLFCWQRVYDYPQVSYGFTCNKRSALIIDSDQYYQSFETAKETVSKFTSSYNLPEITYILRNPQSGHIQFGWITEEDFEVNND